MPLLNNTVKKKLLPGKYPIFLNSFKEYENDKGGYVKVEMQLPDRVNEVVFFPSNLDYFMKCLRRQTELPEDTDHTYPEILDAAMKSDKLFTVISYDVKYGLQYAFHEAVTKENAEDVAFDEDVK